jgi:hypothetical protein
LSTNNEENLLTTIFFFIIGKTHSLSIEQHEQTKMLNRKKKEIIEVGYNKIKIIILLLPFS